ncbi:pentapeptide repeat-containing protein [Argonema antarcticum]|uniref:pentapeptide repeat-containing protein n=1 Tax=Argonema antarcticum TaxID=2942763 RepID=UPI002012E6B7|nr:pentapeptide repeat-containing protein [Argonema antarcticum]MCL1472758.1 pentapeptide repeat-containing protein [Argonema antarcticum A004/B2]
MYSYLGWRAIKGDPRDAVIRIIAVAFAATGGTNFQYANLTDTDFTKATLKNTDFRDAILTRTCFKNVEKLDFARPGESYLKIPQVRDVVIKGQGQDKNFERLNLQGINLKGANLKGASFIEANLQEACLQDANLSDAKLVHTLLDLTDLTGANLTGAYIEGWNITTETKIDGVKCDFVFMRLPPDKRPDFITLPPEERRDPNPRRQPANWDQFFKDGNFADFIAPMRQTLNLYHNKPTDPRLIALAFQQLIDEHSDADIELVAIEKKGKNKDKIILKAETAAQADHAALSVSYSDNLGYLQSLPPETIRALLIERESTIRLLSTFIEGKQKTSEPTITISPNFSTHQNQGDTTMSDKSSNFKFGDVGRDVAGIVGGDNSGVAGKEMTGVAGGEISGNVTVSIGEPENSNTPEAPKLADLLKQLQSAIESDTNLSDKDKAKVLKQVKALAEAGQNPKDEDKKDIADNAITMLKGIVTGLPLAATFVESWNKLLPLITSVFGL